MARYKIFQVDAFTKTAFTGNPAGVVPNATGLTPVDMQRIALEMNKSETAFAFPASDPRGNVRVRFFTPHTEVPICGHATVAAHYVLAKIYGSFGKRMQDTAAGSLPVEVEIGHDGDYRVWMSQRNAEFGSQIKGADLEALLGALGLRAGDLQDGLPVQVVSTGHSKVVIPVKAREIVSGLRPDMAALSSVSASLGCNGFYTWTFDQPDQGNLSHGRMFAPAIGIPEDPVTGNASGCLGAYLLYHQAFKEKKELSFYAGQGTEVGRPGRVFVEARREGGDDGIAIRIAGNAVITLEGEIIL